MYDSEKYQKNKEVIAAAQKRYYIRNREKIVARQKAYNDEHREKIRIRQNEYYGGKSYEVEGLSRLEIQTTKWGKGERVKVKNQHGRVVYITNVQRPSNQKLLAKSYKLSEAKIKKNISGEYITEINETSWVGSAYEWFLFENIKESEFYPKLESLLKTKTKAFKVNIQLGYTLINTIDKSERYFYPNAANTTIFDKPIAINSYRDIKNKVMNEIRSIDKASRTKYPNSSWKLKSISAFKVLIYYREHVLGDNIKIPDCIKQNRHVIDFPKTENKCVFYCIAYHMIEGKKPDVRFITKYAKETVKQYCTFKDLDYSPKLFKEFQPIDLLKFDELEECFKLNINVFEMDEDTITVSKIRASEQSYESTLNILDHKGHAMYITNIDMFLCKYVCNKCDMIFTDCEKFRNHKKNKCQHETLESFCKKPTAYKPANNSIKSLIHKYDVKGVNHYMEHFIVYDFEAMLKPVINQGEGQTKTTHQHIPISVSICDSLTNQVRCFVNADPRQLIVKMMDYVKEVADEIEEYNKAKFKTLWNAIHRSGREKAGLDIKKLDERCQQVAVLGFNSGRYDINLIKNDLFSVIGAENINHAIKSTTYMCIATNHYKFLDLTNYLPGGTSYDGYLKTYIGGCKCDDKIHCVCGLGKGIFPYEYINSFERLNETQIPPQSAFNSKFKSTKISNEDYERVKFIWSHYEMKSVKDLLIWYNNLDVKPFVQAVIEQRKLFKRFDLDMFNDGISLPGLSEKILYKTLYSQISNRPKIAGDAFKFPQNRFNGYMIQGIKADRTFDMTIEHLNYLLLKQSYTYSHCFIQLNQENASADRLDNSKGHINGNITMSCIDCNVARKDMPIHSFRYKKSIEYNAHKLVFSIDEEHADIYHKMKANIAGRPAIIFKRYAERDKTTIRDTTKLCKKVIGYDANALYLWALGNEMPCGRLTTEEAYDGIVDDIMNDKVFGFLECDIRTPERLKDYFSEMTPIFKNIEINPDDPLVVGEHMFEYNQSKEEGRAKKSKKLIGSYFGEKILIYAPLLKWYIQHGLVITKTYSFVKASSHRPFKKFMDEVSDARRAGDVDKDQAMIAEMMKLVGNSAFGRSGMDKSKHKNIKYVSGEKNIRGIVEHFNFHDVEEFDGAYEVSMKKRSIKLNNPIHLSIAIYQLAKLRMLQFYYDCIDKYFDRSDFEYLEMDTDSGYIAFSNVQPFQNLIKPELRDHYEQHKYEWFPREYNDEVAKFDRRTPGLFKEEWRGDAMISLSPKNYICYQPDANNKQKVSAKGVQQSGGRNSNIMNASAFYSVISNKETKQALNKGFRVCQKTKSIITYQQIKTGLNYFYKRQVLADGITTIPLGI